MSLHAELFEGKYIYLQLTLKCIVKNKEKKCIDG